MEVVVDDVAPDEVVGAQPREHVRQRLAVDVARARADSATAAAATSRLVSADVVPARALSSARDHQREAGDLAELARRRRGAPARRR